LLLNKHIPGLGQHDRELGDPEKLYLPLARSDCRIALTFREKIVAIEPGPAFDAVEWQRISDEITTSLFDGGMKVGRDYSFSSFCASGSWRGRRSGVQILPPPDNAPSEGGEHPFILEFPVKTSDFWPLANYRRVREHRNLTCHLNILLTGRLTFQSRRSQHFCAAINPRDGGDPKSDGFSSTTSHRSMKSLSATFHPLRASR
jgi:hypothetical protein